MEQYLNIASSRPAAILTLLAASVIGSGQASADNSIYFNPGLARCSGQGELASFGMADWEGGLGTWQAGRRNVTNPVTFDTLDWAPTGNLPDNRPGTSAFVANIVAGDCVDDDETGVLWLQSPAITIPEGTNVPRLSIQHWFEIERGWDGGNFRISVNGGTFELLPADAFEYFPYNQTLYPKFDSSGFDLNSNPLASQPAYSRTIDNEPSGRWVESRIDLSGIAEAGDEVQLRLDFGIDACTISAEDAVGWYVDVVEFYSCSEEFPPSNCGNGIVENKEMCDDGNTFIGDGCSSACEIEDGWACDSPIPPDWISDHGFEGGTPNSSWTESSNNFIGTPICEAAICGKGGGSGPFEGTFWAWFGGGYFVGQQGSLSQVIVIPDSASELTFQLELPKCDSASDFLEVLVDGNSVWSVDGSHPRCGIKGYFSQSVDISAYADNGSHSLEFRSGGQVTNGGPTNFMVDQIRLRSACHPIGTSLILKNEVINNNGGSDYPGAWTLSASGPASFSGPGPVIVSGVDFIPGSYDLSATGPGGYQSGAWRCTGNSLSGDNTVAIDPGDHVSCEIQYNDIAPTLTVVNQLVNDNGGDLVDPDAFALEIDGISISDSAVNVLDFGDHSASQTTQPGYLAGSWAGDCDPDGNVFLDLNQDAICTISNDDISPVLSVSATVTNNNGGTVTNPNVFGILVDDQPISVDTAHEVDAGMRQLSMIGLPGYEITHWGGDCSPDGTLTLSLAQTASCTVTIDDIAPVLTLTKIVTNDGGGTALPSDWMLAATGPSNFNGSGPEVVSDSSLIAGNYDLSEFGGPAHYLAEAWVCTGGTQLDSDSVNLEIGETAECSITNDDINPTLKLIKNITNDHGGTVTDPDSFGLQIDNIVVTSGVPVTLSAGSHSVSEIGLAGYEAGNWAGDCSPEGTITLTIGQNATCTLTNDDIPPSLTLIGTVLNDNGGTVTDPNAFGLMVDGVPVSSGVSTIVDMGSHLVSAAGLAGYMPGNWGGDCNGDGTINLSLAQEATCTITFDDIAPTLTVSKIIVNDDGGSITNENQFGLKIDGSIVPHNVPQAVNVGLHNASENGLDGYQPGTWGGDCNPDGSIQLDLAENAVCTITNDDIPARLTLLKTIVNDNGGTVVNPDAFGLMIDGNLVLHGVENIIDAGTYQVSEVGLAGYVAGAWGGDCDSFGNISLSPGQVATCTVTNDDSDSTTLNLIKNVNNTDGGSNSSSDWTLIATGPSSFSGPGPFVTSGPGLIPGTYALSESGPTGYRASDWQCNGGTQINSDTVAVELGESVTCSLTNDDIPPRLTIRNTLVNDNGGTVSNPDAFNFAIDGSPVSANSSVPLYVGTFAVSQTDLPGYQASTWGGDCNPDGTISLTLGQVATCTITNDDISPTLKVFKNIVNDDGGLITDENAFGLMIDGNPVLHNAVNAVNAGNHVVSESGLDNYVPGEWGGDCNPDGTITLALAQNATCTITNDDVNTTGLMLIKQVLNDNGGTALASDWSLTATGPDTFSGPGPSVLSPNDFTPGSYDLSESGDPEGYLASDWSCAGGTQVDHDTVSVAPGEFAVCTIVNDDVGNTSLTLTNQVINDHGGLAGESDWLLIATGPTILSGNGPLVASDSSFAAGTYTLTVNGNSEEYLAGEWECSGGNPVIGNTIILNTGDSVTCNIVIDDIAPTLRLVNTIVNDDGGQVIDPDAFGLRIDGNEAANDSYIAVVSGPHVASADGIAGYLGSEWGGDCAPDGSILLNLAETATCTITFNDIGSSLTLVNTVVNDNGGTNSDPNSFNLTIDGASVLNNVAVNVNAGPHLASLASVAGYEAGAWGGDCNPDGSIVLALAQAATCVVTTNDIEPSLTLINSVKNDNGGNANPEEWTLTASGPAPFSGNGPSVNNLPGFSAGTYNLSVNTATTGYSNSDWVCTEGNQIDGDTIQLSIGESSICTISHDDIAAKLKIVKQVVNDNGGTVTNPNSFKLKIDGAEVLNNVFNDVDAGSHTVSEEGLPGYEAGDWGGDCAPDGTILLDLEQQATCTLTNDDVSPTLTLVKNIVNDDGGTITDPNAFNLQVDGQPVSHNQKLNYDAGAYMVSETGSPEYHASEWSGDCNPDGTITLSPGQDAVCTITNDDIPATLTILNAVVNDSGGTITNPDAFGLKVNDTGVLHGAVIEYEPGTYTVSMDGLPGYQASDWNGDCDSDGSITLALGQNAVCSIINDDIAPTLKVVKSVINDNGGTTTNPNAFGLRINGQAVLHDAARELDAGDHLVSEDGLPGYQAGDWSGDCNPDGSITLELDQQAVCTITNDDISPTLKVVKTVVNDNGGTITDPDAFGLKVDDKLVLNNAVAEYEAGNHLVSEDGLPGYQPGDWGGDCNEDGSIILTLGQDAICTITNDDISATLKVVNTVINNNGGMIKDPNAFGLKVNGQTVLHNAVVEYEPGTYQVSENGASGYEVSEWGGDCDPDGSITLDLGQQAVCTVTNDDMPPFLTMTINVINDDGGSALPSDWMLVAEGPTTIIGNGPSMTSGSDFAAGTYSLSITGGPENYLAGDWICTGDAQAVANSIDLDPGDAVSCTIELNDQDFNPLIFNDGFEAP